MIRSIFLRTLVVQVSEKNRWGEVDFGCVYFRNYVVILCNEIASHFHPRLIFRKLFVVFLVPALLLVVGFARYSSVSRSVSNRILCWGVVIANRVVVARLIDCVFSPFIKKKIFRLLKWENKAYGQQRPRVLKSVTVLDASGVRIHRI